MTSKIRTRETMANPRINQDRQPQSDLFLYDTLSPLFNLLISLVGKNEHLPRREMFELVH